MTRLDFRMPKVAGRLGLGIGMDMPWGGDISFVCREQGDGISERLEHFLARHHGQFSHIFFAYQPKSRNQLRVSDYQAAYDALISAAADIPVRALHHTILNTGACEAYDREQILAFTNELCERYRLSWVVEDLGIWTLRGKSLPYPLPPVLTPGGLKAAVSNVDWVQRRLAVPLTVEFPGFTEGASFTVGTMDAYEFFRVVVEDTGSPATLDVGHLLSYQWLRGRTGERMFEGLEGLPLNNTFDLHLSGCQITSEGKYRDLHHGLLLNEQLALTEWLLPRCPNLRAITYEDPKYDAEGVILPKAQRNYLRLRTITETWKTTH